MSHHLRRELGPSAFDGRDLVLADLLAPCFELRELFGRVVVSCILITPMVPGELDLMNYAEEQAEGGTEA